MIAGSLEVQLFAGIARLQDDMNKATQVVGGAMSKVNSAVASAKTALAGLGVAFSAHVLVEKIESVTASMAKLEDQANKVGGSVENLSKLQFFAGVSGSSIEGVTSALVKLSKGMTEGDKETGHFSQALKFLGLNAKDSAGNLKDPAELYGEIAKKLFQYQDGAGKAAIAIALMGKAGAEQLPTMKKMVEIGSIDAVVTTEQAKRAEDYEIALARLNVGKQALWNTIVSAILPSMKSFIELMTNASKETGSLQSTVKGLANDKSIENWADSAAMAVAGLIDGFKLLPKLIDAVGSSFTVVFADMNVADKALKASNPLLIAAEIAKGNNPLSEFKDALDQRNSILENANKKYSAILDSETNRTSKAMASIIDARKKVAAQEAIYGPGGEGKPALNFALGDPAKVAAEQKLFEHAIQRLEEELGKLNNQTEVAKMQFAMYGTNVKLADGSSVHLTGSLEKLNSAHKALLPIIAQQVDLKKQLKEVDDAALVNAKALTDEDERRGAIVTAFNAAGTEQVQNIEFETKLLQMQAPLAQAGLLAKENELKLISRVNLEMETATALRKIDLDLQKAILALGPEVSAGYEENVQKLRDLAAAQKAAIPSAMETKTSLKLIQDLNKNAAEDSAEAWRTAARGMQSSMSGFFFDVMQGNLKNLGTSFKSAVDRMVADALAARGMIALFGKDFASGGNVGGYAALALKAFGYGGGAQSAGLDAITTGASVNAFTTNPSFASLMGGATGADWIVGGTGSTDSKLVQFRATPGETVSVRTPGDQAQGGGMTVNNYFTVTGAVDRRAQAAVAAAAYSGVARAAARNS